MDATKKHGKGDQYREPTETAKKEAHGKGDQYREQQIEPNHGKGDRYTDKLPRGTGEARLADPAYERWRMALFQASALQFKFCLAMQSLNYPHEVAA